MTKIEAIKELIDEEKELYLVENFLECEGNMTNVWNLYSNKECALRWVDLVESYNRNLYPDYWSQRSDPIDDGKGRTIMEERFTRCGKQVHSYFVYEKIK